MRFLPALALALAAAAVAAGRADACSCAPVDVRGSLQRADGAFVGRLVEKRLRGDQEAVYVFAVERSVKGSIASPVEVVSAAHGASCGIEAGRGARIGLFVQRLRGEFHSSLCMQVDAGELLAAARPLPAPDGRGPAMLLVGGKSGEVRTMALDRRGRTLAYGRGRGTSVLLAACPGGRRSVEVAFDQAGYRLGVRELPGLRLVRETPLRLGAGAGVHSLCCGDASASRVQVFVASDDRLGRNARVLSVGGGTPSVVWSGTALAASFDRLGRTAYVNAGPRGSSLLAVRTADGSNRRLATLPAWTGALVPSADGARLAGISAPATGGARVVLVQSGAVSTKRFERAALGSLAWWGKRLVLAPGEGSGPVLLLDGNLRPVERYGAWPAFSAVVRGNELFGTSFGRLTQALAVVPDRGSQRAPSGRRPALVVAGAGALVLVVAFPLALRRRRTPSGGGAAHPEG